MVIASQAEEPNGYCWDCLAFARESIMRMDVVSSACRMSARAPENRIDRLENQPLVTPVRVHSLADLL